MTYSDEKPIPGRGFYVGVFIIVLIVYGSIIIGNTYYRNKTCYYDIYQGGVKVNEISRRVIFDCTLGGHFDEGMYYKLIKEVNNGR